MFDNVQLQSSAICLKRYSPKIERVVKLLDALPYAELVSVARRLRVSRPLGSSKLLIFVVD